MALEIVDEYEIKKFEEAYQRLDRLGKLSPYVKKVLEEEYGLTITKKNDVAESSEG